MIAGNPFPQVSAHSDINRKVFAIQKNQYIDILVKNLSILRASIGMTQVQLAKKADISRQTIVSIKTKKRPMSWNQYMEIVLVFKQFDESTLILDKLDLFSSKIITDYL